MKRLLLIIAFTAVAGATALPAAAGNRDGDRHRSYDRGGHTYSHHPGHRYNHHRHYPRHHYRGHRHHHHGYHRGHRVTVEKHHYTDPAAVILGSAAGGLIGHSLGDGDPYATLSGVIVGGAVGYGLGHEHYKTYRVQHYGHHR